MDSEAGKCFVTGTWFISRANVDSREGDESVIKMSWPKHIDSVPKWSILDMSLGTGRIYWYGLRSIVHQSSRCQRDVTTLTNGLPTTWASNMSLSSHWGIPLTYGVPPYFQILWIPLALVFNNILSTNQRGTWKTTTQLPIIPKKSTKNKLNNYND